MLTPRPQPPAHGFNGLAAWFATGFGLGLVVPAPGTIATALLGLPAAVLDANTGGRMAGRGYRRRLFSRRAADDGRESGVGAGKDHQAIVFDEIVSMPAVFLLVPLTNWQIAATGFALHRLFDITKPPPARQLERLPEGWGIMADDLMAALYACIALLGLVWLDARLGWQLLSAAAG